MADRLGRVSLLLRSLVDLRFEPVTWSGALRRRAQSGEGPSRRVPCSSCGGEGAVRVRGIAARCGACAGRGWLVVDAYTLRPIGTPETGAVVRVKAVRCDSCGGAGVFGNERRCGRCGGSGWVELPLSRLVAARVRLRADALELGPADPVVAALDAGFAGAGRAYRERVVAGSYEELGLALGCLRLEWPRCYRTVVRVYVEAVEEPEGLAGVSRFRHDLGLGYLERLMPEPIRVPGWAARNERRRREGLRRPVVVDGEAA
jgi:hypothetical protein